MCSSYRKQINCHGLGCSGPNLLHMCCFHLHRCGNIAAILELDEHLNKNFKVNLSASRTRKSKQLLLSVTAFSDEQGGRQLLILLDVVTVPRVW